MGGRRRLRAGLPRLYPDHRTAEAVAQRRHFAVLDDELGPLTGFARFEGWRTSALAGEAEAAQRALNAARRLQRTGKGRRPNARQIERLARRAALANITYTQHLDRLRALVQNGHPRTPDQLLADVDRAFADEARDP